MPSSLSLDAHFHRGAGKGFQIGFDHYSLSQLRTPSIAFVLLKREPILTCFPTPSLDWAFRIPHSKSRKAMPVVELATIATTFVSRGPLPVGWHFLRFFWYWVLLLYKYKHRWSSTRLFLFGYPSSINKQERSFSLEEKRKLDAFLKV